MSDLQLTDDELEEAAMAEAYSRTRPTASQPGSANEDQPAVAEAPAEETAPKQTATAEETPKEPEDELAGLPPKVRAMLQELETLKQAASLVPVLERRVRQAEGRLGDLNSRIPVPPPPAPKRLEKVEAVREDLPEVIDAMEELLSERLAAKQEQPRQQKQEAADDDLPTPILDDERPTWRQDLHSSEFQLWLAKQPSQYAEKVKTTTQEAVVLAALGRYDAELAAHRARQEAERAAVQKLTQTRQTRTAAAAIPQSSGRRPLSALSEEDAMEAAFKARRGR